MVTSVMEGKFSCVDSVFGSSAICSCIASSIVIAILITNMEFSSYQPSLMSISIIRKHKKYLEISEIAIHYNP